MCLYRSAVGKARVSHFTPVPRVTKNHLNTVSFTTYIWHTGPLFTGGTCLLDALFHPHHCPKKTWKVNRWYWIQGAASAEALHSVLDPCSWCDCPFRWPSNILVRFALIWTGWSRLWLKGSFKANGNNVPFIFVTVILNTTKWMKAIFDYAPNTLPGI